MYEDSTIEEVNAVMEQSWNAFLEYKKVSLKTRAEFMRAIASGLESADDHLIQTAMKETNLPEARLKAEKGRTVFQLRNYAEACEKGTWLDASIDTGNETSAPPKPDLRKTLVPLGPVVVFGSSNFPFAYSTAGGDTASALAAGCPVVVKAHPAHEKTSSIVAEIINRAAEESHMPAGIFSHVYGKSFEIGKALVRHPMTKAVGFTGSYSGGKQLFDWGNQRDVPIPVFAEMGSTNPVFLLPEKLKTSAHEIAKMYASSITLGVGQFCTNPGIIIGIAGSDLDRFKISLSEEIRKVSPAPMLHQGIAEAYAKKKNEALMQKNVNLLALSDEPTVDKINGVPCLAMAAANDFLQNPRLQEEVFGPYSIIVQCQNPDEMLEVATKLQGQLTATIMGTDLDIDQNLNLIEHVKSICGRIIFNGVPTGVEVCKSMHHGGPFPSTTDSRFTSVGADAIKRFARPLSYQNCPPSALPEELLDENPLKIWRTVNGVLKK